MGKEETPVFPPSLPREAFTKGRLVLSSPTTAEQPAVGCFALQIQATE